MMLHRLHGVLFVLLGVGSIADCWRIARQAREGANFDAIGPDRYLAALGTLLLLTGLWRLLRPPLSDTKTADAVAEPDAGAASSLLFTVALLAGFVLLVPVLGFTPACFLFLAALLRVLSAWAWWRAAGAAALIALAFHLAFVRFADMPLPKGYFDI